MNSVRGAALIGSLATAALTALSLPAAPTLASGTATPLQAVLALVRPFYTRGVTLPQCMVDDDGR
jgi:hypothetical protein